MAASPALQRADHIEQLLIDDSRRPLIASHNVYEHNQHTVIDDVYQIGYFLTRRGYYCTVEDYGDYVTLIITENLQ